jgi:hypothetical protein
MRMDINTPDSENTLTELNFPKITGLNSTFMETTTKMNTDNTMVPGTAESFQKKFNETCH